MCAFIVELVNVLRGENHLNLIQWINDMYDGVTDSTRFVVTRELVSKLRYDYLLTWISDEITEGIRNKLSATK